ncbi:TIGR03643 family protein [Gracilimonas mengyeensis]|uniref:TIGR03643 family protein n=1 Tax=Gracilimonas mengyeensis TaxID=1302730 RepID=A0A521DFH8_9BACT|nr:TIGR03643 family protein [Gracilimonas mengyeensis]SMO70332.1 TIGR03643 family protein [Gracilimonas mengyeensis]
MADLDKLSKADKSRIIEMAWEDRTPFDAIEFQFGLDEEETIALMRKEMKRSSFKMWRKRVSGRYTKHRKKRKEEVGRFVSPNQY